MIKQLAKEQLAIDSLTEVVYRERMDIAMETDRVTSLAKVSVFLVMNYSHYGKYSLAQIKVKILAEAFYSHCSPYHTTP